MNVYLSVPCKDTACSMFNNTKATPNIPTMTSVFIVLNYNLLSSLKYPAKKGILYKIYQHTKTKSNQIKWEHSRKSHVLLLFPMKQCQ